MEAVTLQGVSKTYRSGLRRQPVEALQEVSLAVAPGEVFGLLGPNGAGKTTLVKILLGLVRPTAGRAALLGQPVDRPEARRPVGYLPESHRFPEHLTAAQFLDLFGQLAGVPTAERRSRIPMLLEKVDMTRWRDTRLKKFSKGMLQRLGLAQALLNRPALVFLDEPTDGVDPLGRRAIRDLIQWVQGQGTTVFLNSHLLSEVEQVCTRVAILHQGRLVREGSVADLTTDARRYELVLTPLPARLLAALSQTLTLQGDAPGGLVCYHAAVPDRAALNGLLDHLRDAGVQLDAVRPLKRSLEASFIEVVEGLAATTPVAAP